VTSNDLEDINIGISLRIYNQVQQPVQTMKDLRTSFGAGIKTNGFKDNPKKRGDHRSEIVKLDGLQRGIGRF
jgi:hypothetical protein